MTSLREAGPDKKPAKYCIDHTSYVFFISKSIINSGLVTLNIWNVLPSFLSIVFIVLFMFRGTTEGRL